ncbi:MAG: nucleotidyl transferase AbiEii/AbiGii toxin family protein [Lentimicrobiaceae bacterium]|jgi:hypothetical protein|nr:nucleotidyl transferase AbiEii/AbiGii toxin family protein [Lentimicrobiaceae bacterium]
MATSNLNMIERIAEALGDLKEIMIFVGGSVAELYADFPEISDIRPTVDVDCVVDIEVKTYLDYSRLEERLRALGFQNDTRTDAPICRKIYKGIAVDFMPVAPEILGFSNRWYGDGIRNKTTKLLPNGTAIYILSVAYYLATKLEALAGRGGSDIRGSHDWEDIVFVMNYCAGLPNAVRQSRNTELITYLQERTAELLGDSNIRENIYSVLPYGAEEVQIDGIIKIMRKIILS